MALLLMMFLKFKVASFLKSGNVNFSELKVQSVREASSCFLLREGASCFYRDFFASTGGCTWLSVALAHQLMPCSHQRTLCVRVS